MVQNFFKKNNKKRSKKIRAIDFEIDGYDDQNKNKSTLHLISLDMNVLNQFNVLHL